MVAAPIETHALTKDFGSVVAVRDFDLSVNQGEVFGFLGPNGAGKTTLIRMLLDFIRPTAGVATVLGGSGAEPEIRARVGYLPGDLHLDPSYTAKDQFEFFAALRGGIDAKRRDNVIERFGLDPTRPIGELSSGNRRKVGVVLAFMTDAELLVLDEPTTGLDPLLQHEFQLLVEERSREGTTVFLSSHLLAEVEAIADRVGIIRSGELVALASVEELRARARQRFVFELDPSAPSDAAEVFRDVPSVVEVDANRARIELVVEGEVDELIKAAATLPVRRLITEEADLEEVFLEFYEDPQ